MVKGTVDGDPLIGSVIDGKYTIISLIGRGGMGAVYKARHNLIQRTVAIKILSLRDVDASAEEYLRRFQQEAQTASQIRHPSAITIFDYGIATFGGEGERPFLVMEYIEGQTLKALIAEGRVQPERLIPIIVQVCGALEEAHSLGIVHRDLKPDNIMVAKRSDGTESAHVLDFGIAKVVGEMSDAGMTRTGSVIGTPRYMAPEQILSKPIDRRTDIYSLGLILYESLTGRVPFESPSIMELAIKHVSESPEPLLKRAPDAGIPKALERVIMRALNKEPAQRQDTARTLMNELLEAFPTDTASISGSFAFPRPTVPRSQIPPAVLVIGSLAVLTAVGVFGYQLNSRSSDFLQPLEQNVGVSAPTAATSSSAAVAPQQDEANTFEPRLTISSEGDSDARRQALREELLKERPAAAARAKDTIATETFVLKEVRPAGGATEVAAERDTAPTQPVREPKVGQPVEKTPERALVAVEQPKPKPSPEPEVKPTPTQAPGTEKESRSEVAKAKTDSGKQQKSEPGKAKEAAAAAAAVKAKELEAERLAREAQKRLEAAEQRARELEERTRALEQQALQREEAARKRREARAAREQAEREQAEREQAEREQSAEPVEVQPKEQPEAPRRKIRRRCGPNWCFD